MTRWILAGLLGTLIACSHNPVQDEPDATVFRADEIEILQVDNLPVSKAAGSDDFFNPFLPHTVQFTLEADERLHFEDQVFSFRAPRGSVTEDVDIEGRWLGPQGYLGYDMQPEGLNFERPVQLWIDIQWLLDLDLVDPDRLVLLLDNDDGSYTLIPSSLRSGKLRGVLHHFCKYIIGIGPPPGNGRGHR